MGWLPARAFCDVLELFRDYLCDSEAARRRVDRARSDGHTRSPYDPMAVFSDTFDRGDRPSGSGNGGATSNGLLAIVEALFAVGQEPAEPSKATLIAPDGLGAADGDEPDAEAEQRRLLSHGRPALEPREGPQLRRALIAVEQALCAPAFVESRTPALLGADLSLAAVLLVKGLAAGLLDIEDFRRATRDLWGSLLFGDGNAPGTLIARIASFASQDERDEYLMALCSPRLSAALALWCSTEWEAEDADALWFRLSAAMLHQDYPSLFGAASAEAVLVDLDILSTSVLPLNERLAASRAWIRVIRAGEALRCLSDAIRGCSDADLRAAIVSNRIDPSTLVWVNGRLGFPAAAVVRGDKKAKVRFLGRSYFSPYLADRLVPIRDVVRAGILALPPMVVDEVCALVDAAAIQ